MISKEARESEVDRFIQSRKGSAQLKQERKAKAAAIIKESASSRVAGYTQGRTGRRPIRVDKLLSKLEAQSKTGGFPKQAGVVPPLVQELAFDVLDKLAKRQKAPKQQDLTLKDVAAPGAAIAGGGALVASPTTRGALMGYQRMYHGTESDAAKAIKQQGLLASKGGSGAAQVHDAPLLEMRKGINQHVADQLRAQGASEAFIEQEMKERASRATPRFTEQSTGRVHATRTKPVASFFSNYTAKGKGTKPSILKMDLPMDVHRAFEADPDLLAGDAPEALKRQLGERTRQDIASKYIHGGEGHSRLGLGRELLRKLPGYVRAHPGRFAGGVAATGTGLAAMGYGGKRLIDKLQERGVVPS